MTQKLTVTIKSYDEFNDTFKLSIEYPHMTVETNSRADLVADLCPATDMLEDIPFDLVGQVFQIDDLVGELTK